MKKKVYYEIVNDELIILLCVRANKTLISTSTGELWLNKRPQIKEYLINRYNDSDSIQETIYRIYYHIDVRPVCKQCGGHVKFYKFSEGYAGYCSIGCLNRSEEHIQKVKDTTIKHYGGVAKGSPIINEKIENSCLKKYDYKSTLSSPELREKWKKTNIERYGEPMPYTYGSNTFKQLMLERYGVENIFQSDYVKNIIKQKHNEIQAKIHKTMKDYWKYNISKIEKDFMQYLEQNFKNDYEYQYRSELYPFNCVFYIKSLDLYIEIQGTWQHGKHPYNENAKEDNKHLNFLKEKEQHALNILKLKNTAYTNAIQRWTIRDVKKRNTAKENNLNYLEIFSTNIYECIIALFIYKTIIKSGYWIYTLNPSLTEEDCVRNPIIPHILDKLKEIE